MVHIGNGFGNLLDDHLRKRMEVFDDLPSEVRNFVATAPVKLSMKHLRSRYKNSLQRKKSVEDFLANERNRIKRLDLEIQPLPEPPKEPTYTVTVGDKYGSPKGFKAEIGPKEPTPSQAT
jgi:hypothetical protein